MRYEFSRYELVNFGSAALYWANYLRKRERLINNFKSSAEKPIYFYLSKQTNSMSQAQQPMPQSAAAGMPPQQNQ